MLRQTILSIALAAAVLAAGLAVYYTLVTTAPTPPTTSNARPPLLFRSVPVQPQTVTEPISGYGTARADRAATLAAQVAGEVVWVDEELKVGAAFARGAPLVRIDAREYQRQLERAQSLQHAAAATLEQIATEQANTERLLTIAREELEIARRERDRVQDLFESDQAGKRELDLAKAAFAAAQRTVQQLENRLALVPQRRAETEALSAQRASEVELAQLNVERCEIRAPFDGEIESVSVEISERVMVGAPLTRILDPRLIEVPVELPVSMRGRVRRGAPVLLTLPSEPDQQWQGTVKRIAPRAREQTRTFALFVEIDNPSQARPLVPGMFVRAEIEGPRYESVLLIPRGSIQRDAVFVFDDGVARERVIVIEHTMRDRAIVSGLRPGERLITSNLDALFDGRRVAIDPSIASDERTTDDASAAMQPSDVQRTAERDGETGAL